MEDASLDDFLDGPDGADTVESADGEAADREDDRGESSDGGGGGAADREAAPAVTGGPDTDPSPDAGTEGALGDPGVGPVPVTYRVSPGGSGCDECGRTVDSRWRDGEAFVCADCKSW
jgi:hypothetical protein